MRRQPSSGGAGRPGLSVRRLLFICSRNRLRSPTAEALFADLDGVEVGSAGTAPDAECAVSADLIEWATDIVVMEQRHKKFLLMRFSEEISGKRLTCLNILDRYELMQPELIVILQAKVLPLIEEKRET